MNNFITVLAAGTGVIPGVKITICALSFIVCALAVLISVAVAMQSSKEGGLSGTIAGSGESFFGKSKGMDKDRVLSLITLIASIVFVVLTIVLTVLTNTCAS